VSDDVAKAKAVIAELGAKRTALIEQRAALCMTPSGNALPLPRTRSRTPRPGGEDRSPEGRDTPFEARRARAVPACRTRPHISVVLNLATLNDGLPWPTTFLPKPFASLRLG
jgi:hypothetical protein